MNKIPKTDSVTALAHFWDTHDVTMVEDELEEVTTPVFGREDRKVLRLALPPAEADALHRAAQSKGMKDTELVLSWVSERLRAS